MHPDALAIRGNKISNLNRDESKFNRELAPFGGVHTDVVLFGRRYFPCLTDTNAHEADPEDRWAPAPYVLPEK